VRGAKKKRDLNSQRSATCPQREEHLSATPTNVWEHVVFPLFQHPCLALQRSHHPSRLHLLILGTRERTRPMAYSVARANSRQGVSENRKRMRESTRSVLSSADMQRQPRHLCLFFVVSQEENGSFHCRKLKEGTATAHHNPSKSMLRNAARSSEPEQCKVSYLDRRSVVSQSLTRQTSSPAVPCPHPTHNLRSMRSRDSVWTVCQKKCVLSARRR